MNLTTKFIKKRNDISGSNKRELKKLAKVTKNDMIYFLMVVYKSFDLWLIDLTIYETKNQLEKL